MTDRLFLPFHSGPWLAAAIGFALLAGAASRFGLGSVARLGVGLAILAAGGGWHHHVWFDRPADSLDRLRLDGPTPCRIRGVLAEVPERLPAGPFDTEGSTRALIRATAIDLGDGWRSASGGVLVYADGGPGELEMGDPAVASGSIEAIPGPRNPGESDRRDYWRSRGVGHRLRANRSRGLVADAGGEPDGWLHLLGRLRERARWALIRRLDPGAAAVASALVLGRREAIDPEVSDAFVRTGTTHILAISGLHMVAVAGMLGVGLTLLGWRRRPAALAVLAMTIAYAILVGLRPSVVRAAAMTAAGCYAAIRDRPPRLADLLALAACVTLLINPAFLFDVGCQLSFLAVAALAGAARPLGDRLGLEIWRRPGTADPAVSPAKKLDALELRYGPSWRRGAWRLGRWALAMLLASAVVWAVTLPLVSWRFHIVPVAGILLNLALVPMAAPILGSATLAMGLGPIWPPLAIAPAWACSRLIEAMIGLVRLGAEVPGGFAYTAGPPGWWVATFYPALVLAAWASTIHRALGRIAWVSLLAWVVAGVGLAVLPTKPTVPEAHVLAVDHGLAVVVRSPSGRTLLYDCGRMYGPHVGREVVAPALWALGARRVDVAIVSHADSDHYNGFGELLERIPIGEVWTNPGFQGEENPGAGALLGLFKSQDVPIQEAEAGDRLDLGGGLSGVVLHPPPGWLPDAPDNARSLVLDLGLADGGDRFLLTGDLEGAGLAELWANPPEAPAAMLAPHHGGKGSNPPWFYDAIRPGLIVASQRRPPRPETEALAPLERSGIPVLRTWRDGAVRLRWAEDGLRADGFLDAGAGAWPPPFALEAGAGRLVATITDPGVRPMVAGLAFLAGLIGGVAIGIVEFGAWTLVVPGRRVVADRPEFEPSPWEPITVAAPDGAILAGAWLGSPNADGRTIALVHGFGEDRGALVGRAEAMSRLGWNAAVLDSRARGGSGGGRTTFGALESSDLITWLDVLEQRAGPGARLAVWGRSMGAAIALRAAAEDRRVRALILEAAYDDLRTAVASWLRRVRVPGRFAGPILARAGRLAGVPLSSPTPLDLAPRVDVPTLIVHGAKDRIALPEGASRLLDALGGDAELLMLAEAHHGDVFEVGGPELIGRVARLIDGAIAEDPIP